MLVLTRKVSERIRIGDGVIVTIVRIQGDKVRIGIDAPPNVAVHREEVYRRIRPGDDVGPRGATAPSGAPLPLSTPGRSPATPGGDALRE